MTVCVRFPVSPVLVRSAASGKDRREAVFSNPTRVLAATRVDDVVACLSEVAASVARGQYAAGFLAYEAAPAFDPAFLVHATSAVPLVWFGLFDDFAVETPPAPATHTQGGACDWHPLVSRDAYFRSVERIGEWIRGGHTYQVNYTYPLQAPFGGDAMQWHRRLVGAQDSPCVAFVDTGRHQVLCASPELFFEQDGDLVTTRPMKGTAARAPSAAGDRQVAAALRASPKELAENLMIVDLLRSDLGRVARTGSVAVRELFAVERYETVWQMTSAIQALTDADIPQVMAALFPCGSVTGAPKVRTMQIIHEVEPHRRGVYCGAVGWWAPGRRARFSVPIRTVVIDAADRTALFHVGSGIVADSSAHAEYAECAAKTRFLFARPRRPFRLLETLLFDKGYVLLDEHLDRLAASADYFGFRIDPAAIRRLLLARSRGFAGRRQRVRLTVSRDGRPRAQAGPCAPPRIFRLALAPHPVDESDPFLHHKTTQRDVYDQARAACPEADDTVLWNRRGQITETTIANLVVELDGRLLTPHVDCGLLAGTMRGRLLRGGGLAQAALTREDLGRASRIWLVNSVRGWMGGVLDGKPGLVQPGPVQDCPVIGHDLRWRPSAGTGDGPL